MKQKLSPLMIMILAVFMISSCRKDHSQDTVRQLTDQEIIDRSKTWYESILPVSKAGLQLKTQSVTPDHGDPGQPDWLGASVQKNDNGIDVTLVNYKPGTGAPLHLNATNGERKLRLYSEGGNVKEGYVLERDSDRTSGKNSFTGNILTYDLNGKFISGERYEAGILRSVIGFKNADQTGDKNTVFNDSRPVKIKSSATKTQGATSSDAPNRFYKIMGGGMICMDWYVRACVPADNWCSEWRWDGQTCTEIPSAGAGPGTLLPTGGSGGSGGTGGGGGGGGGHTTPSGTGGGGGAISADPYTEGGSVGYGPDPYYEDIPDGMPAPSVFLRVSNQLSLCVGYDA